MSDFAGRVERVREKLADEQVDALLVTSPANVYYLSGFPGEGYAVISTDRLLISTDGRYKVESGQAARGYEAVFDPGGHLAGAASFLLDAGGGAVAFEAAHLTYAAYQDLTDKLPGLSLKPAKGWIESLRLVKSESEIACIREAAQRVDLALDEFLGALQVGKTERQLALELESALIGQGTEAAFSIILACGSSAACPHAVPSARALGEGDLLKIDVGGRHERYCSDITRTYFIGQPCAKFREVYGLVKEAQAAAVAAVRPGITGREVDAVARQIIADGGYAEEFSHGLGHGVGLEVHEGPRVSSRSEDVLQPGMVITVEPGIYLEGWGGVRIEDTVVVTETGCEALTTAPKPEY